jgi:xeroderma pigmentosum group C-complementing protein
MIHKKTQPDASRRTRLFLAACFKLAEWWHSFFRVIPNKGIRSQTYLEAEQERKAVEKIRKSREKGKFRATAGDTEDFDDLSWSDKLRSVKSLMKHALLQSGSADTCSLLFTALCRALGIPARLIVSLQAVPWSSKSEKFNNLDPITPEDSTEASNDHIEVSTKRKGHSVALRRSRPKDRKPRVVMPRSSSTEPPLEGWPPVVWTEVFSRPEGRWIPIDPVRYLVDKKKMFEPPSNCRINRMMYVVAFEEGENLF